MSGVGIHDSSGADYFASSLTSAAPLEAARITRMAVPKVKVVNQRREFLAHALARVVVDDPGWLGMRRRISPRVLGIKGVRLCKVSPRPAIRSTRPWRFDEAPGGPVISVLSSWAETVIPYKADA